MSGMDEKNEKRIEELEAMMASPDFWLDKEKAQALVQEYQALKEGGSGDLHDLVTRHSRFSPAQAATTQKISRGCFGRMYEGYATKKGWRVRELHANENDHGGYRNVY